jgi:hypothetical protein
MGPTVDGCYSRTKKPISLYIIKKIIRPIEKNENSRM